MRAQRTSMAELRERIDRLDDELIGLLGERIEICHLIGQIKARDGLAVMQEDRVAAVQRRCAARAEELGLDPSFVLRLYDLIIEHACGLEVAHGDAPALDPAESTPS